jgi:hypothetical protein
MQIRMSAAGEAAISACARGIRQSRSLSGADHVNDIRAKRGQPLPNFALKTP